MAKINGAKINLEYFPFYFWDFENSTEHLEDIEKMGYIRVLAHLYKSGGTMPDDRDLVRRYARFSGRKARSRADHVYDMLEHCVKTVDNRILVINDHTRDAVNCLLDKPGIEQCLTQSRVVEQLEKIIKIQKVNKERAKRAALARWGKRRAR